MPLHDINYKHWEGVHLGVWSRRWAIAQNGLTACLQDAADAEPGGAVLGCGAGGRGRSFLVGQLLVADSVVVRMGRAPSTRTCRASPAC